MFQPTTAITKILKLRKRLRIIQGGSSAGKTIGILLILIDRAQCEPGKLFSVVSESFPHLKRGAIRDFLNIMETQRFFKEKEWNKTDFIYTFSNGSRIEFFSADQPGKVRGPRRNVLFINECNNISFETYTQLAIRTSEDIYLDYNPVIEFWVHTDIIPKLEHDFLILTYQDNEQLPAVLKQEIEARRDNKSWFRVYGEGQLGEIEGKIYKQWRIIDEIPHEARLERTGLDFGYTNDPTAIVDVYYYNGGYILDEVAYEWGMGNKQIVDALKIKQGKAIIIADSAEPKSIDDIAGYGITILPASKGPGSVNRGISFVQNQRISITRRSVFGIKEYQNYIWLVDKNGKILNEEDPKCANHFMSATRYAIDSLRPQDDDLQNRQQQIWRTNEVNMEINNTQ